MAAYPTGLELTDAEVDVAFEALHEDFWTVDSVTSVVSITNLQWTYTDDDGGYKSAEVIRLPEYQRKLALSRSGKNLRMVDLDTGVRGLWVDLDLAYGESGTVERIEEALRNVAKRHNEKGIFRIYLTGEIPLMAAFARAAAKDSGLIIPSALIVMFLLLWLFLFSARMTFSLLILALISALSPVALLGFAGINLDSATSTIPLIVITLSIAIGIHYAWSVRSSDYVSIRRIRHHRNRQHLPILISAGTTVLGFLLLLGATSIPLKILGIGVSVGICVSTILTLYWLPLCFERFELWSGKSLTNRAISLPKSIERWLESKSYSTSVALAVFSLMALPGLSKMSIGDDFVAHLKADNLFTNDTARVSEVFGGPNYLEISLRAPDGVFSDSSVALERRLVETLQSYDAVVRTQSLLSDLTELGSQIDLAPDEPEDFEQLLFLYSSSMPVGQDSSSRISADRRLIRVTAHLDQYVGSSEILLLRDQLQERFQHVGTREVLITGVSVPTSEMAYTNTVSLISSCLIAALFAALFLALMYQSISIFPLVVVGILLPLVLGFGIYSLLFREIGLAAAIVISACVGVLVDDMVHLIHRLYRSKRRGGSFRDAATPILMSSAICVFGFGLLGLSNFGINSQFGITVSIVMASAALVVKILGMIVFRMVGNT